MDRSVDDNGKDLLSVEEVAEYLGVDPATIYRWCREGRLPCLKLGRLWRLRRASLEDFLRQEERPATIGGQLRSFLDVLPAHVALVDGSGTIVAVNRAWRDFARSNRGVEERVAEGVDYLQVCDSASGERSEGAYEFAQGMRSVLSGSRQEFAMEYPCHSPEERRWFLGRVTLLPDGSNPRAVVVHESVTDRK
jgi:excisionase family DNA binding protein